MKHRNEKQGFTLVELLVVMAIIAILAGLLLPGLAQAKFQARDAVCRNNLRQLSIAMASYTATSSRYPLYNRQVPEDWMAGYWWNSLGLPLNKQVKSSFGLMEAKFLCLGGVFQCPINTGTFSTMQYGIGTSFNGQTKDMMMPSLVTYGYNAWGTGGPFEGLGLGGTMPTGKKPEYTALSEGAIQSPANLIMLGDCFSRSRNPAFDAFEDIRGEIGPETYLTSISATGLVSPFKRQPAFIAHKRRANRVFADGHLSREDMRKAFAASDIQLSQWNVDQFAHRDQLQD